MHGSLQLFGDVGRGLVRDAERLLQAIPATPPSGKRTTATGFAEAAQREFDLYRDRYEGFDYGLEIQPAPGTSRISWFSSSISQVSFGFSARTARTSA